MKQVMTTLLLAIGFSLAGFAQEEDAPRPITGFKKENMFIGGNLTLNAGGFNNTFLIGANPIVGYSVLPRWIDLGVGLNAQYFSSRYVFNNNDRLRSTTVGAGVFTRLFPIKFIFFQAQPEFNYIFQRYDDGAGNKAKETFTAPAFLVGAGYKTNFADGNTYGFLSILWDVIKDPNSPYLDNRGNSLPIIRAGFQVGLGDMRQPR